MLSDQRIDVEDNKRQNHAYGGQPGNTDINVEGTASYLSLDDIAKQQIKEPGYRTYLRDDDY